MENNAEKINDEIKKISQERMKLLEGYLQRFTEILKSNGFNQKNQYTSELTEKFDKEEPIQFVWIKFVINFVQTPFVTMTPQGLQPQLGISYQIIDMDVYEQSSIDGWLDHVKRIEQQNNLYYEKNGKVQNNKNINFIINETKFNDVSNIFETNIMNPNPEKQQNQQQNENENEFEEEEEEEYPELTDEEKINEQRFYFMPFFSGVTKTISKKQEYLDIYTRYTKNFANRIMQTHIYGNHEDRSVDYTFIHQTLMNMVSEFENCNFTSFTKKELEIFGFTNWKNKSMMIPLWAFPIILKNNDGLKLVDIHGKEYIIGKDFIEEINKNGCMAVGFPMKKNGNEFELILNYDKIEE